MTSRAPALFVSHGAPTAALEDDDYTRALARYAARASRPRAIVVVSAHWETVGPARVNAQPQPSLVYDFYGFPEALSALTYPAPGSPDLAHDVLGRLTACGVPAQLETRRGWDHGVWVPLRHLYPAADVPVVSVSLPLARRAADMLAMGRALAPLRREGVLLFGSGGVVHNLRRVRFGPEPHPVENWARTFDCWVADQVARRATSALAAWATHPQAALAVPTSEHFDPLLFVVGASDEADELLTVYEGFRFGSLSLRSLAFEPRPSAA